jgi:peptidoglycan/LPS O-acetylase OafA/YrhL
MTTASPPSAAASDRVGTVDSLRCFAMTAVVAQHCGIFPVGWTGVWLFFVISGYVVTRSARAHAGGTSRARPRSGLAGFYRRRAVRIFPVYYAYLAVGLVVIAARGLPMDALTVAAFLGFVSNLALIEGHNLYGWPVAHLWTIAVEMQFYLFYGLILFRASPRTIVATLIAALFAAPLLRGLVGLWLQGPGAVPTDPGYAIYAGSFLHVDAFAAGALLAFLADRGRLAALARPLTLAGLAAMAFYCLTYIAVNMATRDAHGVDTLRDILTGLMFGQHREVALYSALTAASAGVVALAVTRDRWLDWLLRHPVFQHIGAISYGGYVYHLIAIAGAGAILAAVGMEVREHSPLALRVTLFVVAYALTLLLAEGSYRTLETWFSRPRRPGAAASRPIGPPKQQAGQLP